MKKAILIVLGIVAVIGGGIVVFVLFILGATKPVVETGDKFLTDLKESKYEAAYAMLTEDTQREIGSPEAMEQMVTANNVQPVEWSFSSRNINSNNGKTTGSVSGSVTFTNKKEGEVQMGMIKQGDDWKVQMFRLH